MKTFYITLKHDGGKTRVKLVAVNEQSAREIICRSENCPESAIVKIKQKTIIRSITLKNWANTNLNLIEDEYNLKSAKLIKAGFKRLPFLETLRDKNAIEVVIFYAWYWRGEWADKEKGLYCKFYKN